FAMKTVLQSEKFRQQAIYRRPATGSRGLNRIAPRYSVWETFEGFHREQTESENRAHRGRPRLGHDAAGGARRCQAAARPEQPYGAATRLPRADLGHGVAR